MKRFLLVLSAAGVLATGAANAADAPNPLYEALGSPDNWTISGTFRVRVEGIDDQFRPAPAARDDGFLSFRTTLFAEYHAAPVRIGAELFDSRGYGEKKTSSVGTTEINALELGQAYLALDFGPRLGANSAGSVTAGRFTMDDGARRLIARNQFRNTINSFTGVRFDWADKAKDRLRLFWTMPQIRLPNDTVGIQNNEVVWDRESTDFQFYGGSFTKAGIFGGTAEIYGYGLDEKNSRRFPTRSRHLFTPGIRLARAAKSGMFDYDFEAVYQTGHEHGSTKLTDLKNLDVSAYFFHAEVGRTFAVPWSPRVALQYDLASGNGSNPNKFTRFDTLFGARRGEYGPTSLWGAVQRANLNSPALRVEVTPDKRWDGFVAWRPLFLQSATDSFASTGVQDAKGRSGKFAGNQLEARARYWLIPKVARLDSGVAWLFKGGFLEHAPNAPHDGDSRYGYVDLTFAF